MWTPTHVVVTVTKARNLLEKGKGGNDAYCMIGMGKEKFLTSVKTKTLSPIWDEQAEFSLGEREDLKLTVYHKSSIIDEFIGRVVINIAELAAYDNTHSHVGWFKLCGKPDKSEHSKKPEKERGEIEVRIDFVVKPKAGSMMDLSYKTKEKSLSLRNLKDKSNTLKQSLGDKFKLLNKSRKSKYAGENQLAEQAKRMGGSKIDFLDGDDGSITSSYSSINGSNLQRFNDSKQVNAMSRFNAARSSFLSGNSSRIENDSSSNYGQDNTRNEDDFEYENESGEFDRDSANGSSFQRRNSSKFGRSASGAVKRQLSRRSSNLSTPIIENLNIINENSKIEISEEQQKQQNIDLTSDKDTIHIAPLPPFNTNNSTSTPALSQRNKERRQSNENDSSSKLTSPTQKNPNNTDSFASIFAASFSNNTTTKSTNDNSMSSNTTLTQTNTSNSHSVNSSNSFNQTKSNKSDIASSPRHKQQAPQISFSNQLPTIQHPQQPPPLPPPLPPLPPTVSSKKHLNYSHDDDDHIDWASSEDEEIVKQEIETFERNQVPNKRLENNINIKSKEVESSNNKIEIDNLIVNNTQATVLEEHNSLFSDLINNITSNTTSNTKPVTNSLDSNLIPLAHSFSIDIDPFSSTSTSSSTNSSFNKKTPVFNLLTDPFGLPPANLKNQKPIDPFSIFDTFTTNTTATAAAPLPPLKMNESNMETAQLDFSRVDELDGSTAFDQNLVDEKQPDEFNINTQNEENSTNNSNLVFYRPNIENQNNMYDENDEEEQDDNIDNAFITYSNNTITTNVHDDEFTNEMTQAAVELADSKLKLHEIIEEDEEESERVTNVVDKVVSDSDSDDSLEENQPAITTREHFSIGNVKISTNEPKDDYFDTNEDTNQSNYFDNYDNNTINNNDNTKEVESNSPQLRSTLSSSPDTLDDPKLKRLMRQSERRRLKPAEDLISDLNSDADFNNSAHNTKSSKVSRTKMQIDLNKSNQQQTDEYDIKTPDVDNDFRFQEEPNKKMDTVESANNPSSSSSNHNGLPDLINQKGNNDTNDKARKYLEGLDGVKFNEIQVPDQLKKQLEYFDRDELLQLIAYQKKYLDFKESRIKDLENYIDNLVVKIIEKEPSILMNASNVLTKSRNLI